MEETAYIDGCAASSAIDTAAERLSIEGLDISSLEKDGVFGFEHDLGTTPSGEKIQIKIPQNVVGKILKAKKIFSEEDCEDDRQRYYWGKVQCPYVYVMGCLFNAYTDSAKHLYGLYRYDADHRNDGSDNVLGFSIEGGKLPGSKQGIVVGRSLARKVTIAVHPANKQCISELIPNPNAEKPSNVDSLFKTCQDIEIQLFKTEQLESKPIEKVTKEDQMRKSAELLGISPMVKSMAPQYKPILVPQTAMSPQTHGAHLGSTKSGKSVFANAKVHHYNGFSSQDHQDAATFHHIAAGKAKDPTTGNHHLDKMKLHLSASKTQEHRENRLPRGRAMASANAVAGLAKALDAGSMNAAPGTLVGGGALQKEELSGKLVKTESSSSGHAKVGDHVHLHMEGEKIKGVVREIHTKEMGMGGKALHPDNHMAHVELIESGKNAVRHPKGDRYFAPAKHGKVAPSGLHITPHETQELHKTDWLARSEQEYSSWPKREVFENLMKSSHPEMTPTEIQALGCTLALADCLKAEEKLAGLVKKA